MVLEEPIMPDSTVSGLVLQLAAEVANGALAALECNCGGPCQGSCTYAQACALKEAILLLEPPVVTPPTPEKAAGPTCPNCTHPIEGHPQNSCVLAALIDCLRDRGDLSEEELAQRHADCDMDPFWDDMGPVLDRLEDDGYTISDEEVVAKETEHDPE
jgi:hypothetical protein